jgi:hypothetical protein
LPALHRSTLLAAAALAFATAALADSTSVKPAPASTPITTETPATPPRPDSLMRPMRKPNAQLLAEADSALKARGGARADSAQLFLSWNAPWGRRRAKRERLPACADSATQDTLYLCMTPGRTSDRFLGFTAELLVHPTGADTLGPWWHMQGKGGENPGAMLVEWSATQDWDGAPQPFPTLGQGFVKLDTDRAQARVRMIYATPIMEAASPLDPKAVYALARMILKHNPRRRVPGCDKPVVIEWATATLTFGIKDEPRVARGERFATYGGSMALAEAFREARVKAWKPPPPPASR